MRDSIRFVVNNYKVSKNFKPRFNSKKLRVGRKFDGGYVVSQKALKNSKNLFSAGLYDDWSFENDFLKKNLKSKIFIFDGSINLMFWSKYLIKSLYLFIRGKINFKNLISNFVNFFSFPFFIMKKRVKFISKNIVKNSKNIDILKNDSIIEFIKRNNLKKIFFKIDIESNEYSILNDLIETQKDIECLVIEFHEVGKNMNKIYNFIKKLRLKLVHIHVNNYGQINDKGFAQVLEFTFVKLEYCFKTNKNTQFPISNIDYPNNPFGENRKVTFN